ncbi:MAG: hypothetical protein JRN21_08870 [Nitrososphaerota archaeon]|nr:hypothetical protein [Nitrososphaerota archaeon]
MTGLRYLYEQETGNRERFVYHCSRCHVFEIRRSSGPDTLPVGLCRECGRPLEENAERTLVPIPEEWSGAVVEAAGVRQAEPFFRRASSIPHFSLGLPGFDSLLRPLSEKRLVVLSGAPSSAVAELVAFRAQLPVESGGLDSAAVFIDGGNQSDPYLFSSFARQQGLRPTSAMRRVASCRVFTFYQLASLVSEHLAHVVEDYGAKLVVVSDILGTFNEPGMEEREARRVLDAVQAGLEETKNHALVFATLARPNTHDVTVMSWADATIAMSADGDNIRAERLEHRNKLPESSTFKLSQLLKATRKGAFH